MQLSKDDLVKEEVLKEAQKLFRQFGLRKTTMEDIARAIGKGKSTLYYYYSSKEEIFDAVAMKEMEEVFNNVSLAVEKAVTAEEKLKAFTLTRIRAVQKRVTLYRIVNREMQETVHCIKHLHNEYDKRETKLVEDILRYGIGNGEFEKEIADNLDILPSVMVSSLRGLERDMFLDNRYAKLESRMESIMTIMMRGLQCSTARKTFAKTQNHSSINIKQSL